MIAVDRIKKESKMKLARHSKGLQLADGRVEGVES
jgi:hypothetical protein